MICSLQVSHSVQCEWHTVVFIQFERSIRRDPDAEALGAGGWFDPSAAVVSLLSGRRQRLVGDVDHIPIKRDPATTPGSGVNRHKTLTIYELYIVRYLDGVVAVGNFQRRERRT